MEPSSSILTVFEDAIFDEQDVFMQDIIENDPVNINISAEDGQNLPEEFLKIADKLHQNYLYWKHRRARQQTTQPTFYRYIHKEIEQAATKVAESGTPIEQNILLILDAKIAFITLNSLLIATEDYLKVGYLQDAKECIDTALSVLYELIKTREKLEAHLEAAVASIREDLANEPDSYQYASYLASQILLLQQSPLISEPRSYVVRSQLDKLGETLTLLMPVDGNGSLSKSVGDKKLDDMMTRLMLAMVDQDAYTITITHQDYIKSVSFSPDGTYLATASNDNTAKLVEVATGRVVTTITHQDRVYSVSFSPDGTYLATASNDNTAKLVEVATGRVVTTIKHRDCPESVEFSPDGTYLVTRSRYETAKLVEVATGREVTTITHQDRVTSVSFSPDGTYRATASYDRTAKLVEVATSREVTTIKHQNAVSSVTFSPDGTYLATASSDRTAKLVEVATGREVTTIKHQNAVSSVTFSPDGTYLATTTDYMDEEAEDETAKLVEVATGRVVTTISPAYGYYTLDVTFSPDGTYLATKSSGKFPKLSFNDAAKLVEVATGREVTIIEHYEKVGTFFLVLFSPDGTYLVTKSYSTVKLVEVATGRVVTTITYEDRFTSVSFSPDGTYLATASYDKTAKLVEVATGRVVTTIIHQDGVNSVSFSPDGTYLVTASWDKTAKLVEIATSREVTTITHQDSVNSVSFSPDGTCLVTKSSDNTVKLINLRKLSQLLKEQNNPSLPPQPEIAAIVHLNKPEAFFLGWLRIEANRHSFYDYMLKQATEQELSLRYHSPVLETNLLLQSLGFLLINAEKHYQTVYPTLMSIDETEVHVIAMQDMKQSISAALSTLYEFIFQRMELDNQDYNQAIASFKQEIEEQIDNSNLLIQFYHKLQLLLQLEGIKTTGELQTLKDMLLEIDRIFKQILPEEMRVKMEAPVIPVKQNISTSEIMELVKEADETNLIPLLANLNNLGLLNNIVALAAIRKITPQRLIELCRLLPQTVIDKQVAIAAINKGRETHYIGTIATFDDIINKEILIKILESAPHKTWWRR